MSRLFEDFAPVETSRWMEVVTKDLKGQDFDKRLVTVTEDGIKVKPIYRREDLPAEMPAARGCSGDGRRWAMREEVKASTVDEANSQALRALEAGSEELAFHTYPYGSFVSSLADMEALLKGIYVEMAPIHWISGPFSAPILSLYAELVKKRGLKPAEIKGSVDLDPIMDRASGRVPGGFQGWQDVLTETLKVQASELPAYGSFTVRGSAFQEAGASLAQELAFAASVFVEYLEEVEKSGLSLSDVVAGAEIRLGVSASYLLEISKLRAARVVLANVLRAYGLEGVQPRFHAVTTGVNKTLYDPHNNILRATIESMAAVVGGADSLSVGAFDQAYKQPDEFSRHLSRNTEILLRDESHLDKVADPLGGAYAIEVLTASIAEAAWTLFTKIQEEGGFCAAWTSGMVAEELGRVRKVKEKAAATRRTPLVGTSIFPNPKEKRADDLQAQPDVLLASSSLPSDRDLDSKVTSFSVDPGPLSPLRLAEPFEALRLAVERTGEPPVVQLLLSGSVAMRKARAGFCLGFFGCAGLDVKETILGDELPSGSLYVLCSSDDEYLGLADKVMAMNPQAPVWVAGLPQESLEALKAKGVADFVHIRVNPIEALTKLLPSLGVTLAGGER